MKMKTLLFASVAAFLLSSSCASYQEEQRRQDQAYWAKFDQRDAEGPYFIYHGPEKSLEGQKIRPYDPSKMKHDSTQSGVSLDGLVGILLIFL